MCFPLQTELVAGQESLALASSIPVKFDLLDFTGHGLRGSVQKVRRQKLEYNSARHTHGWISEHGLLATSDQTVWVTRVLKMFSHMSNESAVLLSWRPCQSQHQQSMCCCCCCTRRRCPCTAQVMSAARVVPQHTL